MDLPQRNITSGHHGNNEVNTSPVPSGRQAQPQSPSPHSPRSPHSPHSPHSSRSPRSPHSPYRCSPRYMSTSFLGRSLANGHLNREAFPPQSPAAMRPAATHQMHIPSPSRPGTPFVFSGLPSQMNAHGSERSYAHQDRSGYFHPSASGSQPCLPSLSATFGGIF